MNFLLPLLHHSHVKNLEKTYLCQPPSHNNGVTGVSVSAFISAKQRFAGYFAATSLQIGTAKHGLIRRNRPQYQSQCPL